MDNFKAPPAIRFFFLGSSCVIWLGIYLTGFSNVHWLLYVPPSFFVFAAITGICPGLIMSNRLFAKKRDDNPTEG